MPAGPFGTLEDMVVRDAFAHEALDFTPWVQDNIGRLADALEMPLENVEREVAVDEFAADLRATNPIDGSIVLIENQLTRSDHGHLGQILTYAAGLNARTIVWVAPEFRASHLSAIRWLNQSTREGIAFFAVKVRVVRIGSSLPAPLFEVVERPDEWERQVHQAVVSRTELSEIGQFRAAFWRHHCSRHPDGVGPDAASSRWAAVPGRPLNVVSYVSKSGVGVFVRSPRGEPSSIVLQTLGADAEVLADQLGAKLRGSDADHFLASAASFDMSDLSQWDAASDWLDQRRSVYLSALSARAGVSP